MGAGAIACILPNGDQKCDTGASDEIQEAFQIRQNYVMMDVSSSRGTGGWEATRESFLLCL